MPLKRAQYDSKCYCNSVASTCCSNTHVNCLKRNTGSGSIFSVASKRDKQISNIKTAEKNKQKTDFVKVKTKPTVPTSVNKNHRGLGHSNLHRVTNFSRRNSAATTVTFSTPCATPASIQSSNGTTTSIKTPSPPPSTTSTTTILKNLPVSMSALGDNFSALSVSSKSDRGSDCGDALPHEYTEQRRYYESAKQLMKLISAQGDRYTTLNLISGSGRDGITAAACVRDAEVDAKRLRQLQEFRLQNAEDCFSVHRQLDLHLPIGKKTLTPDEMKQMVCKLERKTLSPMRVKKESSGTNGIKSVVVKQSAKKPHHTAITPYAVRQRLLQLRLEAEELKRERPGRKLYRPLENSCALRYQETY